MATQVRLRIEKNESQGISAHDLVVGGVFLFIGEKFSERREWEEVDGDHGDVGAMSVGAATL